MQPPADPQHVKRELDVDAEESALSAESASIEKRLREFPERLKQGAITFGRGDDNEEQNEEAFKDVIDLTCDLPTSCQQSTSQLARNTSIPEELSIRSYDLNGAKVEAGSAVEMKTLETPQYFKSSFLYIQHIIDTPDGILLRGIPLTRSKYLRGRLPRLRNEVVMILHVDNDDNRLEDIQAAIEVPVSDVIKVRNCHFTNADVPQYRTVMGIHRTIDELEENGVLMCRWRCIYKYRDSATRIAHIEQTPRMSAAPVEYIIEHLSAKHIIKPRFVVSETSRFNVWRGGKIRGGEYIPEEKDSPVKGPVVQLDGETDPELVLIEKKPGQRYTFGDMFCGAGGASLGAEKAGLHIHVACDHHLGACRTYSKVFPQADLHMLDIFKFITLDIKIRVDILHLSPPCQFWSPAHTCAGINDDANIAALSSCHELISKLRPRIFTLEQTFGILHPRFEYYFNALLHGFTANNYSIRWKIVDLIYWGVPATRKRLVMIGSCPGEELPPFPKPTHITPELRKKRGKRKPYVTVKKMLARIPRDRDDRSKTKKMMSDDGMHRPREMVRKRLPRWDPDVTLKRCITTNGGYGNYHPSGRRDFTLREYATLQTFPIDYPFENPDRKRQIGNAFPPLAVKVLYAHLRKWLEARDRVYAVENEPFDLDDPDVEIVDLEDCGGLLVGGDDKGGSEEGDLEYIGSQSISPSSSSMTSGWADEEGEEGEGMDIDFGPMLCVDANQNKRRVWPVTSEPSLGLTAGNNTYYVDLTEEND